MAMNKPSLKILKQQRNGYRTNVKKQLKGFEEIQNAQDDPSLGTKLKLFIETMQHYSEKIDVLDLDILQSIDEDDDAALELESGGISEFRERMVNSMKTAEIIAADSIQSQSHPRQDDELSDTSSQRHRVSVRLPKLEPEKYSGDPLKFQEFWDSFESTIHQNAQLVDVDKFKYLRCFLSGDALSVVEGYRLTSSNYSTVVDALKDRYGNPEFAVNAHFEKLLELPSCEGDFAKLPMVYAECEKHIRSLVALGRTEDVFGEVFAPIILSKLPRTIRIQLNRQNGSKPWKLSSLREMLKDEMKARELSECYGGTRSTSSKVNNNNNSNGGGGARGHTPSRMPNPNRNPDNRPRNANGWYNGSRPPKPPQQTVLSTPSKPAVACSFCKGSHYADKCDKFATLSDRRKQLNGKCFKCLWEGHGANNCSRRKPCFYCRSDVHHSSLCPIQFAPGSKSINQSKTSAATAVLDATLLCDSPHIQMQMATVQFQTPAGPVPARIFFDTGSTRSYMKTSLLKALDVKPEGVEVISVAKFGSHKRKTESFNRATLTIPTSRDPIVVSTLVTDLITCPIQKFPVSVANHPILENLPLADPLVHCVEHVDIDMLIGADYYYKFVGDERIALSDGLYLLGSKLGYIVTGKLPVTENIMASAVVMYQQSYDDTITRFWELEDIGVKDSAYQTDNDKAMQSFDATVKKRQGRYEVTWPWKAEDPDLPTNYGLAVGRLKSLVKRLESQPKLLSEYDKTIKDQIQNNVVEAVHPSIHNESRRIHYIPHHCVIRKDKSTTKLRIVYDASAKISKDQCSLNDCLLRGPVLLEDLCGMLLRFRLPLIAMVSDVEKAFLQVGIQDQDRDVTRFLWLKDTRKPLTPANIQTLRFARVPFGAISSPFLLAAVIRHHMKQQNSNVADDICSNLYVDNVLAGRETTPDAIAYYTEAKCLFAAIQMNIREWYSNSIEFRDQLPAADRGKDKSPKVLGLKWDCDKDTISCSGADADHETSTKRQLLQCVSTAYDPCGFFSPIVVRGKILIQELWKSKLEWDDKIPIYIRRSFEEIKCDLAGITDVQIPRLLPHCRNVAALPELHCFCDASARAYAAACYLRRFGADGIPTVDLIFSKARLAPTKPVSLPRLELMATVVGVRLAAFITRELRIPFQDVFVWTDSQCVLHWIGSDKALPIFVKNRINELKSHPDYQFRYVPTTCNPADIPSRGVDLKSLRSSNLWWHGPQYLQIDRKYWPENVADQSIKAVSHIESVSIDTASTAATTSIEFGIGKVIDGTRYSSLTKLLRVTAWVRRFLFRKRQADQRRAGESKDRLSSTDLIAAETEWVKYVQTSSFGPRFLQSKSNSAVVNHLGLFKDNDNVIKCRGRLRFADLSEEAKQPALLPKNNWFTNLVIMQRHGQLMHAGVRQTLAHIRHRYWIPHGASQVQKELKQCVMCRKFDTGPFKVPKSPPLPAFRVNECLPFDHVGIDYIGPFIIKEQADQPITDDNTQKAWICLFTCSAIRAVHLEVVTDATAEQFLLALRRFVALYGKPTTIISDNAKNFKATSDAFQRLERSNEIQDEIATMGITWQFITELAPWMGGFYERLVGSVKRAMRKTIGRRCLTLIQLQTTVAEISEVINSRPLVPSGPDVNELALTPAHFLARRSKVGFPTIKSNRDPEFPQSNRQPIGQQLINQWAGSQMLLDQFWNAWRNEYLAALRDRPRPNLGDRNPSDISLRPGVVVLLKEELPRSRWKLAIVVSATPSCDGIIRSATVRTQSGKTLMRAIKHLYPIEQGTGGVEQNTDCEVAKGGKSRRKHAIKAAAAIRSILDNEFSDDE